jgi:flavorubredoxin
MTMITEIAPDVFRISTFVPDFNLQFNQFVVRDDEPLLFHTGLRALFPVIREAVSTLLDPARIRWIGFSHLEADECGTLPDWQTLAPNSTAVCSLVGKLVSIDDCMAVRPAKGMTDGDMLVTGEYRF